MERKVSAQTLCVEGTDRGVVAHLLRDQPETLILTGPWNTDSRGKLTLTIIEVLKWSAQITPWIHKRQYEHKESVLVWHCGQSGLRNVAAGLLAKRVEAWTLNIKAKDCSCPTRRQTNRTQKIGFFQEPQCPVVFHSKKDWRYTPMWLHTSSKKHYNWKKHSIQNPGKQKQQECKDNHTGQAHLSEAAKANNA